MKTTVLWGSYYNIPKAIFYLPKGNYKYHPTVTLHPCICKRGRLGPLEDQGDEKGVCRIHFEKLLPNLGSSVTPF